MDQINKCTAEDNLFQRQYFFCPTKSTHFFYTCIDVVLIWKSNLDKNIGHRVTIIASMITQSDQPEKDHE